MFMSQDKRKYEKNVKGCQKRMTGVSNIQRLIAECQEKMSKNTCLRSENVKK